MKNAVAQIIDDEGVVWEFEGYIQDNPIWVREGESRPLLMTENEAYSVAIGNAKQNEKASIRFETNNVK